MSRLTPEISEGRPCESIHIGGVVASGKPLIVRTILGSCISVCLRDPFAKVGGMNHFMLPDSVNAGANPTSFGVHAMELLINRCMNSGADKARLEAKVFGGAHVLNVDTNSVNVADRNIQFAKRFLRTEGIRVVSHDVGGFAARELFFFTDSGRVLLRRMSETGANPELKAEVEQTRKPAPTFSADDENVTLF